MSAISIRAAHVDDCAAISAIYNHYVVTDTCTYAEQAETVDERRAWFARHDYAHPVIVAEEAGVVIGWAALSVFHARSAYRFTVEDSIYLRPDRRGRGLGSTLLGELIARGRGAGHRSIIATISAEQAASIALHRRHGFVDAGRLRDVGWKFDRWLDCVYLQRPLA